MRVATILAGVVAAAVVPALALFTAGETAAAAALVLLAGAAVGSGFVPRPLLLPLLILFAGTTLGASGYVGYHGYQLASAITVTTGPSDPPEPVVLERAEEKIEAVEDDAAFRVRLTEPELVALIQEGLQEVESPVRRVDIEIVGATDDQPAGASFRAEFKSGDVAATGELTYALRDGGIELQIVNIEAGAFSVPGFVRDALEDLVEEASDLNEALIEHDVGVQSLLLEDGALVLIGTRGGGDLLTSGEIVAGLTGRAAALGAGADPLEERLGRGEVNDVLAPGDRYYVALGDSLAAGVGGAELRDGYVSRLHRQLELRDGRRYGLRNFGEPGETSATLVRGGQLDAALDFIAENDIAYVTLDIGANDIIPHLGSLDCEEGAAAPACAARIEASLTSYRETLSGALDRLVEADPDATIVFLLTYNPFSFGSDIDFERDTDRVTGELNDIASELARERGVLVADGLTPLSGRAVSATHMTGTPPDIHPTGAGHDALAAAILDALG